MNPVRPPVLASLPDHALPVLFPVLLLRWWRRLRNGPGAAAAAEEAHA